MKNVYNLLLISPDYRKKEPLPLQIRQKASFCSFVAALLSPPVFIPVSPTLFLYHIRQPLILYSSLSRLLLHAAVADVW